jgi:hypothetical protein
LNVYTISVRGINPGSASISITGGKIANEAGTEYFTGGTGSSGNYTINLPATSTPIPTTTTAPVATAKPSSTPTKTSTPKPTTLTTTPGITLTPTLTPTCIPDCNKKSCGTDKCGGRCGSCLSGFSCSQSAACTKDNDFDEEEFINGWNGLGNEGNIEIDLGLDGNNSGGFSFHGRTTPNTLVNLYIFSDPIVKSTISDSNGDWSIIVSESLDSGSHKIYAVTEVNGIVTKNTEIIAFTIDPVSNIVALEDTSNSDVPLKDNLTETVGTTTPNNTWIYVAVLIVFVGGIGVYIYFKKRNHKVEAVVVTEEIPLNSD